MHTFTKDLGNVCSSLNARYTKLLVTSSERWRSLFVVDTWHAVIGQYLAVTAIWREWLTGGEKRVLRKMGSLYARLGGAFPFGFQIEGKKCVTFCTWTEKSGYRCTYDKFIKCCVIV